MKCFPQQCPHAVRKHIIENWVALIHCYRCLRWRTGQFSIIFQKHECFSSLVNVDRIIAQQQKNNDDLSLQLKCLNFHSSLFRWIYILYTSKIDIIKYVGVIFVQKSCLNTSGLPERLPSNWRKIIFLSRRWIVLCVIRVQNRNKLICWNTTCLKKFTLLTDGDERTKRINVRKHNAHHHTHTVIGRKVCPFHCAVLRYYIYTICV